MTTYEKLATIQQELKAPKNQFNKFGNYYYRNCEDILEAVKPLLAKYKATVLLTDSIVEFGGKNYIEAQAQFIDIESEVIIATYAFAREEDNKKGFDSSQLTGSSSTYARKYALNGLLLIDDTKDADTTNTGEDSQKRPLPTPEEFPGVVTKAPQFVCDACGKGITEIKRKNGKPMDLLAYADLSKKQFGKVLCQTCAQAAKDML